MTKILVIDDDTHMLKMLGMMLARSGYETVLVNNGQEGIERALAEGPDLIIVDIMMPDMSGHEVCQKLRADPATVEVPILVLTARAQLVDRDVALSFGADDFMAKPVAPKELSARVDQILNRPRRAQQGRILTIFSLKGGVGTTTIATNIGAALRSQQVPNITIVDLSPNSGNVTLQLRIQAKKTWSGLVAENDLDADTIRSHLINHPSGLNILAAPLSPMFENGLTEKQTELVAKTLGLRAEFVIIDAPPTLSPMCIGALKSSDLIMIVLAPDIASIQSVTGALRALVELGISGRKVHLILNNPMDQRGLPKEAVERALKRAVTFRVPFDKLQYRAMAQGKPLSLQDIQSPLADSMRLVAAALRKSA